MYISVCRYSTIMAKQEKLKPRVCVKQEAIDSTCIDVQEQIDMGVS